MIFRSHIFRRAAIVGVGLMGGSLGMALKKHRLAGEVVGISQKQETVDRAIQAGAIDSGFIDIQKGLAGADLVILAAPVEAIVRLLPAIGPCLRRGCIVTDVGSTKADIVEKAESALPVPGFFVGSHPLAGSERNGVEHACADLFENARCIMTPTPKTNQFAREKVKHLWTKLGARVEFLSPEEHDRILAYVSHLPHLLAYGLMGTIPPETLAYAPQGLKDMTRIAASSPQVWNDICMANPRNILKALDECVKQLSSLRKAIINRDSQGLMQQLTSAKKKRDAIQQTQTPEVPS